MACGIIKDKSNGKEYIVAAGGQIVGGVLDSTELLDVSDFDAGWTDDTGTLPTQRDEGEIVRTKEDTLIYLGGKIPTLGPQDTMLQLSCSNKVLLAAM